MNVEADVEKRLQALVAKDRIRIKEFFIDFDKLRKGQVGEAGFRTCMGTLNVRFSEEEITSLINKYKCTNGLINYADFCKNIDTVFSDKGDPTAVIENSKSSANFTDAEKDIVISLLAAIRTEIKNKRILIKPQLEDYDRTKSCHITAEQFRRVLKELKLIPPDESMFQLLLRKYFDKGNVREINYFKFCADIDRPEDIFPQYVPKNPSQEERYLQGQLRDAGSTYFQTATSGLDVINNRFMQKRVETSNNPSDIEERLQALVVMKRVRIEEFFFDFDKLRKGKVTKNQFESILSMLNISLTFEELNSLFQKYKTNDPQLTFNYHDFCKSINSAFTTYGIQKDPKAQVSAVTVDNTVKARRKYLDITDDEAAAIEHILEEYRAAVRIKRIQLKPMF